MSGGDGKDHNSGAHDSGGSINGTSGKGGPSSGGASDNSGWSSENNPWGGGNSGTIGGDQHGNGGGQTGKPTGWGWGMTQNPDIPPYTNEKGEVVITIVNGLAKTPVYGTPLPNGKSDVQGGYLPGSPKDESARKWDKGNLPREFDASVEGFKYHVTLNDRGIATGIKRTAMRALTKEENLQNVKAKMYPGDPRFPPVDLEKNEPARQAAAKQQAETAWKNLPPNVRSFNVDVDGFKYGITVDDYGSITAFKKIADRPLTKIEAAQKKIAENAHKVPSQMYPGLDFTKGEPERQTKAQKGAQDVFNSFSMNRDRIQSDVLNKTADIISDTGEKLSEFLGKQYKAVADTLANDIKNYQGKTIRSFNDAMKSLNKITSNPGMKINKGDKDALINAWKQVNTQKVADNLGTLSKAFNVVDKALKAEKIREKSIEGYDTGNWGPLMLEVESWVLSGVAASVAIGIFAAVLSALPITGLALTTITIAGIITISFLAAKIDDKVAEMINKELIKSAN
ncbi:MAG: colicin-like pore-forming protein [Hafnia alvei]|uniref:colicin-like pore-forming protein n=1 Tax=Hafnia alvei TaxID=569 RepID=UPI002913E24A|nr:colicin-like pore-forming protein [Hafnia alvei]MDU7483724.1 colicin-like pore-forming protein [Hafnia alvei]